MRYVLKPTGLGKPPKNPAMKGHGPDTTPRKRKAD